MIPVILRKCNRFIFFWNQGLLPAQIDLVLYRLLGRKVFVFNCGDDVRYRPLHEEYNARHPHAQRCISPEDKTAYYAQGRKFSLALRSQRIEEVTGCTIVTVRNQATFLSQPAIFFRFPAPFAGGRKRAAAVPLIVHAPSDRVFKGTRFVEDAIAILRREGIPFRFELIENQPNEIVLRRLREADLVIDQPGSWIARFAMEGMAAGCGVIGGNNTAYEGIDDDCPVVQFHCDGAALASTLRKLLIDQKLRQQLMDSCHAYWARHYAPPAFLRWFILLLRGQAPRIQPFPDMRDFLLEHTRGMQHLAIRLLMPDPGLKRDRS